MTKSTKPELAPASPYTQLRRELVKAGAIRLAVIDGPNKAPHPGASELEFWTLGANAKARLLIVQRWHGMAEGGFDYYLQGTKHQTAAAIADCLKPAFLNAVEHISSVDIEASPRAAYAMLNEARSALADE